MDFDSHCHVRASADELIAWLRSRLAEAPSRRFVLCGTHPAVDWDLIEDAATALPSAVVPAFGLHPWFIPNVAPLPPPAAGESDAICGCAAAVAAASGAGGPHRDAAWPLDRIFGELQARLERNPTAIVGEIGLDKLRFSPPGEGETTLSDSGREAAQLAVFERQLDLAAQLHRPVSVHCVRAFGPMLTALQRRAALAASNAFPPAVVLHGFCGSPDFVNSLLKLPKKRGAQCVWFGLGAATSMRLANFAGVLAAIPRNRLVLETDLHVPDNDGCGAQHADLAAAICGAVGADRAAESDANATALFDTNNWR